jgi:iron complex outermembrane receptor protein
MRKAHLSSISLLALTIALPASAQQSLPTIEIGATPLRSVSRATARSTTPARPTPAGPAQPIQSQASTGTGGSRAPYVSPLVTYQVPAAVHVVEGAEIANVRKFNLGEALQRTAPGVIINDVGGNPGFPEINYRGFNASPFAGVPQGLAVFQGGIRVNEMWGDTVNWDLIPSIAIDRVAIETGNPLYGLNAIGGAIVLDMKNGFTWQGAEVDVRGGSFMRRLGTFQFGKQVGDFAVYAAGEAMGDKGYRYFSGSNVKRFYGDIGYKAEQGEVHANVTLGSNYFGASGPAPVEMVAADKSATYTTPQTYKNQVAMFDLNGQFQVTPTTKLLGDVHYRGYNQARVDGNTTELECESGEPFCETSDGVQVNVPNFFTAGGNDFTKGPALGAIDRTWTKVNTIGFTTQINNTDRILGFANKFTMGLNLEHGFTDFKASQELGVINQDSTVTGFNYFTSDPLAAITPVHVNVANYYLGAYALDTIDLTEKLSATGGLRYNRAQISSFDNGPGGALNANNKFNHVNPMGGLTYKITPEIAAYSSYSVANRAPTPLELGCSDPNRPCIIDAFMVADPPLKQVTSNTIDTGLRGGFKPSDKFPSMLGFVPGAVQWTAGIFRTNVFDDIFAIPSKINGRGYFQNAGNTVRQGVELSARYNDERTSAYINYSITDAYMNSQNYLPSPGNPIQQAIGANSVLVNPGAQLPSIANHRFKTGVDYSVTKKWKIGGDFVYATGPYLGGDWANQFGTLSPYGLLNLRTSYNFLPNVQMYALIENVTNTRSRNFGSLFETNEIPFMNYNSPKMVSVGPPTAFFAGMKWDYGNDPSTSSWIASANGMYEKDRDTEIKTKTPKKWGGLYAGLNAGYGWGATTGANTTAMGIADAWSNTINGDLTSEAEDDEPWGLSNTGAMAMANTGLAQVARNGFIGGGQFGYNYQDESDVVLGAEADIQGTTFSGAGSYANAVADSSHYVENGDNFNYSRNTIGGGSVTASLSWIGTFRARLGYTLTPNILAYGTGGLAYGAVRASSTHWTSAQTYEAENGAAESSTQSMIPGFSNYSGFRAGWTAGGGIEWMLRDNWSLRAEGLYYNLGSPSFAASPVAVTCSGVACAGAAAGSTLWASTPITKIQFDGVIVRGGVNYHFDWGKADTVVAKY